MSTLLEQFATTDMNQFWFSPLLYLDLSPLNIWYCMWPLIFRVQRIFAPFVASNTGSSFANSWSWVPLFLLYFLSFYFTCRFQLLCSLVPMRVAAISPHASCYWVHPSTPFWSTSHLWGQWLSACHQEMCKNLVEAFFTVVTIEVYFRQDVDPWFFCKLAVQCLASSHLLD